MKWSDIKKQVETKAKSVYNDCHNEAINVTAQGYFVDGAKYACYILSGGYKWYNPLNDKPQEQIVIGIEKGSSNVLPLEYCENGRFYRLTDIYHSDPIDVLKYTYMPKSK